MIFLQAIIILFILNGLYQLFKYYYVFNYFLKHKPNSSNILKRIIIVTPVLSEEKNIEKYLDNLLELEYQGGEFGVRIVTTEKELSISNNKQTNTITILDELLKSGKYKKIDLQIIHYPKVIGVKRDQLNYAFDVMTKESGEKFMDETYFLFLDVDSIIDKRILYNFSIEFVDDINIYQQPLIWFKNFEEIKGKLMSGFAFLQTFFSISYEIPMFNKSFFPLRLKYAVGHGLCLKGKYLRKIGGFPELIEDVRIGRISSFLDEDTRVVSGFGNVEVAKNFLVYIKQLSVWFFGCGLFVEDFKTVKNIRNDKRVYLRDFVKIIYGYFKAFRWLNKGLIHLLFIVIIFFYFNSTLLILISISFLLNIFLPVILFLINFRDYWEKGSFFSKIKTILSVLMYSVIVYMFSFIGLYYGLYKIVRYKISGEIFLPKTDR